MAGIGFELRHMLRKNTLLGLMQAYTYASVIGSGPWVLSIVGILLIGIFSASVVVSATLVTQFQTSVTYLVACSLIYTGLAQLAFTRFVSDRMFERRKHAILPNLHGLMALVLLGAGGLGTLALFFVLPGEGVLYRLLMLAGFILLSGVWILTVLLSGMKRYKAIVALFALSYGLIVVSALLMRRWGLEGLLGGFVLGHYVLLAGMWLLIVREFHPARRMVAFDFLQAGKLYPALVAVGFLWNLGIWADKFMFWFFTPTSQPIIGHLRASLIYDLPVFLSYLSIIPGMAVFLVRIETDFAEWYERVYDAIRGGETLQHIGWLKEQMILAIRQGLMEICKVQGLTLVLLFLLAPQLLSWLGISHYYLPLFYIDVIGVSIQVVFMALLNVFFYLDKRAIVLELCVLFVLANGALTLFSQMLGPTFFGYGFTLSLLLCVLLGLYRLNEALDDLEFETFMLSR